MPLFFRLRMKILSNNLRSVFLVTLFVTLAFWRAVYAPFLSLDDRGILDFLQTTPQDLQKLFLSGGGDYYRPLTFVSFIFDLQLWGRSAAAFHLVNVVLHLFNTLLVCYLAEKIISSCCDGGKGYGALLAGLLFALHPVNVEAVMWVAARTDLLCCLFFLLALVLVVEKNISPACAVLGVFTCLLLSLWSKESSIGFFGVVAVVWLLHCKEDGSAHRVWLLVGSGAATILYLLLRTGLHVKADAGVTKIITAGTTQSLPRILYDSCAALGFYISKIFLPFPLNFAIVSINKPISLTVAGVGILSATVLFWHRPSIRLPLLVFFVSLVPPVLALHAKLPWTPYAERYLYLPMTGVALFAGVVAAQWPRQIQFSLVCGALLLSIPSMQRVALWTEPMAFWEDVLQKSPEFPRSYAGVAFESLERHQYDKAETLYKKSLSMGLDREYVWRGLAAVYLAKNDLPQYEKAMLRAAELSPKPTLTYISLIRTLENQSSSKATHQKAILYYLLANQKDPTYGDGLYNAAKEYIYLGDTQNALKYFKLFLQKPGDSMYQPFAQKLIEKIERGELVTK